VLSYIPVQTNTTNTRVVFKSCISCNEFCLSERLINFRNKSTDFYQIWYGISKLNYSSKTILVHSDIRYITEAETKKKFVWLFFLFLRYWTTLLVDRLCSVSGEDRLLLLLFGEHFEWSGHVLIEVNIPVFAWKDWGKARISLVWIARPGRHSNQAPPEYEWKTMPTPFGMCLTQHTVFIESMFYFKRSSICILNEI
jgi:hypothetical protein